MNTTRLVLKTEKPAAETLTGATDTGAARPDMPFNASDPSFLGGVFVATDGPTLHGEIIIGAGAGGLGHVRKGERPSDTHRTDNDVRVDGRTDTDEHPPAIINDDVSVLAWAKEDGTEGATHAKTPVRTFLAPSEPSVDGGPNVHGTAGNDILFQSSATEETIDGGAGWQEIAIFRNLDDDAFQAAINNGILFGYEAGPLADGAPDGLMGPARPDHEDGRTGSDDVIVDGAISLAGPVPGDFVF